MDDVRKALDELQEVNFGVSRPDALTLVDVAYDWLEFRDADPAQFSDRRREESFREGLRKNFFDSLRSRPLPLALSSNLDGSWAQNTTTLTNRCNTL